MWTAVKSSRFPFTCLVRIELLMIMSREKNRGERKVDMRLLRRSRLEKRRICCFMKETIF